MKLIGQLARTAAVVLLLAWAAGVAVAAVRLAEWEREVVQALLQIRADRAFRVRQAQRREPVPREWYRAKALALLAAGERLQDDGRWARFVPGAWLRFDGLRERLAQRIEREFSEIAVDTIRRELHEQVGELAGVARDAASGELLTGRGCADPSLPPSFFRLGAPPEPAERRAVDAHLDAIERLDRSVRALAELQSPAGDAAAALRLLVRDVLGAEPPGRLSHSASLVRQALQPAEPAQQAVRSVRLQHALRCSLGKRMALLDARVFERNDLLASEQALVPHLKELYRPGGTPRPFAQTLAHWRETVALLAEQQRLAGAADGDWLKPGGRSLGATHELVLARVARIGLLGDETVRQLRRQSAGALQRLHSRLARSLTAGSDPALVWLEREGRFVPSPQRVVLREQLGLLLQEEFMAAPAEHALPDAAPGAIAWDLPRLSEALQLGAARRRFASERLPGFPAGVRAAIAREVDRRFAQLVEHVAASALAPVAAQVPADVEGWRLQREQAARVQALLAQLGARDQAARLRALLAGDLLARLGSVEQAFAETALASPRLQDFGWWGGDGAPLLAALGVADGGTLREVLAQQVRRLEVALRQAAPLLQEARLDGGAAAVERWRAAAADLERYRAGRGDSSLGQLERALTAGAELQAASCVERLAGWPAPAGADLFAERHRLLRDALARRCGELRAWQQPLPAPAAVPFG